MCDVLISLLAGLTSTLRTRASLQVEILALRHQLAVLQRNKKRQTSLRAWDRILWVALARLLKTPYCLKMLSLRLGAVNVTNHV